MAEWVRCRTRPKRLQQLAHFDNKDNQLNDTRPSEKKIVEGGCENGTAGVSSQINEPAKAKRRSHIDEYLQFIRRRRLAAQKRQLATDPTKIVETVRRCGPDSRFPAVSET